MSNNLGATNVIRMPWILPHGLRWLAAFTLRQGIRWRCQDKVGLPVLELPRPATLDPWFMGANLSLDAEQTSRDLRKTTLCSTSLPAAVVNLIDIHRC